MDVVWIAGLVLAFGLVGTRLERVNITAPMAFLTVGSALFALAPSIDVTGSTVHTLAEVTLVVLLFHDASTVQLGMLKRDVGLPARLLGIGFPLALAATFGVLWWMFPALGAAGALLVAAAITPTDAGLGAPTVLNPVVPTRVRRALNVESGLNDGLATPIVLFALSLLAAESGAETPTAMEIAIVPVALGVAVGIGTGILGALTIDASARSSASSSKGREIALLCVPFLALGIADVVGANVFIAAFVAGLAFGAASRANRAEHAISETLETTADLLGYVVWFMAGGLIHAVFTEGFNLEWLAAAVLALTVLRAVPVGLSLLGTRLQGATVAFIGWFGPRGLASVIFGLLAVEELGTSHPVMQTAAGIISVTVVMSVFAHGFTAGPLAANYGRWIERKRPEAETSERGPVPRSRGRALSA